MTKIKRKKNDTATLNRRNSEDKSLKENRIKNDELTSDRRSEADENIQKKRLRNDKITLNRRKIKDRNPWKTFAISLLVLAILTIGIYYFFF